MENKLWQEMKKENSKTLTENGAITYSTSTNEVLDLFAMGGALRKRNDKEVEQLILKALSSNFELGVKCLFYLRDVRCGIGERKTFRTGLKVLGKNYPKETEKLLSLIPEYGRWDDVLSISGVNIRDFLIKQLAEDYNSEHPSLLAKWLPSENASSPKTKELAIKLRKYLGFSSKEYRNTLTVLREKIKLVEQNMSKRNWKEIEYDKIPSKAGLKYKKAFSKHDAIRYVKYLEDVKSGKKEIKTGTLFPYEIVRQARKEENETLELLWKNLPDYTNNKKAIVVADTSGSMAGNPLDIAVSLAMYFAERNKGVFSNKFITFSQRPTLQEVKGRTLSEKIKNLDRTAWESNTNLQAVFDLILNTAVENDIPEELPSTIYIVSDMEFDEAIMLNKSRTNFEAIRMKYYDAGYNMPTLVFWNVDSRNNNLPVSKNQDGVVLVSGCSPSVFKMITEGMTPEKFMLKTLNSERYNKIGEALNGK
jgi:hypothetical protein